MTVAQTLREKLTTALSPERLIIVDESHRHVGHAGHHADGETHFTIEIVAAAFSGQTRLERQRLVYAILAEELAGRVHALSLRTLAPGEVDALAARAARPEGSHAG